MNQQTKPFYAPVKDEQGEFIGIWVADPDHPNLKARLEMFAVGEKLPLETYAALADGNYRRVENTFNDLGGAFLMLGDCLAPGEKQNASISKKKAWWKFW